VKCQKLFEKENGKELLMLIKEFFQFYNMDYANCVFASEANVREEVKREVLALKLGIDKPDPEKPLLMAIIERSK
jgi:predicted adenine nucleotide alpha hydrolase (AANH) superfamily ATPase